MPGEVGVLGDVVVTGTLLEISGKRIAIDVGTAETIGLEVVDGAGGRVAEVVVVLEVVAEAGGCDYALRDGPVGTGVGGAVRSGEAKTVREREGGYAGAEAGIGGRGSSAKAAGVGVEITLN